MSVDFTLDLRGILSLPVIYTLETLRDMKKGRRFRSFRTVRPLSERAGGSR